MNRIIIFTILAFALHACAGGRNMRLDPVNLRQINLSASRSANESQPFQLDVVFPFNNETLEDLEGFSAKTWFEVKETNLGNWKENAVWKTLEIHPGQQLSVNDFPEGFQKGIAAVVFANYRQPGLFRIIITDAARVQVEFRENEFAADAGRLYLLTSPPEIPRPQRNTRF